MADKFNKFRGQMPVGNNGCDDPVIDYKDVAYLSKFVTPQAQIQSRRRSQFCTQCQRQLKREIKRARHLALLAFSS